MMVILEPPCHDWSIVWSSLFFVWPGEQIKETLNKTGKMKIQPLMLQVGWPGSTEEFFRCWLIHQIQSAVSQCPCWTLFGQLSPSCQIWYSMRWQGKGWEGWICHRVLWNICLFDKAFCTWTCNHDRKDSSEVVLPLCLCLKNWTFCCTWCLVLETV